jgi:hypothetical protein
VIEIIDRFERLWWHDSPLLTVEIHQDRVRLRILMNQPEGSPKLVDVTIHECLAVKGEFDFKGKRACRDSILEATCEAATPWITAFRDDHREWSDVGDPLHFTVVLVPPGGTLEVLGKDFTVEAVPA